MSFMFYYCCKLCKMLPTDQ